jgi:hypothetical protein
VTRRFGPQPGELVQSGYLGKFFKFGSLLPM